MCAHKTYAFEKAKKATLAFTTKKNFLFYFLMIFNLVYFPILFFHWFFSVCFTASYARRQLKINKKVRGRVRKREEVRKQNKTKTQGIWPLLTHATGTIRSFFPFAHLYVRYTYSHTSIMFHVSHFTFTKRNAKRQTEKAGLVCVYLCLWKCSVCVRCTCEKWNKSKNVVGAWKVKKKRRGYNNKTA